MVKKLSKIELYTYPYIAKINYYELKNNKATGESIYSKKNKEISVHIKVYNNSQYPTVGLLVKSQDINKIISQEMNICLFDNKKNIIFQNKFTPKSVEYLNNNQVRILCVGASLKKNIKGQDK